MLLRENNNINNNNGVRLVGLLMPDRVNVLSAGRGVGVRSGTVVF